MNTISDTALLETLNAGLKPADQGPSKELGQAEFFELMLAQLKNQDPTKPMDGQEYLGQLAQFSTVNGIQGLQQSFNQLSESLNSLHALQASSLVGRSVAIEGGSGYLGEANSMVGSVKVTDPVDELTVIVNDGSGQELRRLNLGPHSSGEVAFSWDGRDDAGVRVAPGVYDVRAEGRANSGLQVFATSTRDVVQSVSLGQAGRGMTLNLAGLGERDVSAIREIL